MTKKHFIIIARTIYSNLERANQAEAYRLHVLADELATEFYEINPRFNRATFLTACGFAAFVNSN